MNGDKIQKYKKKIQNKCDEMCTFLATLTYVFGTFCNQNALTNGIKFKTSYSGQRTFYIKKATREKRKKKTHGAPKAHATRAFQGFRIIRALLELRLKSVILTIFSVNF